MTLLSIQMHHHLLMCHFEPATSSLLKGVENGVHLEHPPMVDMDRHVNSHTQAYGVPKCHVLSCFL